MGKVLKGVAIAAAFVALAYVTGGLSVVAAGTAGAATVAGVTFTTTFLGGMLISMGAAALLTGISQQFLGAKIPRTQISRLNVSLDPSTPRKVVFGTTAMPLDLRYHESSGTDQEYVDYIIALAAHKVASIDEIWFEEKQAWTASGGVTGTYSGYLTVTTRTEGTSGNYISINGGGNWGSTRRLTGCAYLHLRIKRTGNSKKAESPLAGGLPSRVTVIGNGALLYDPRKDSTVPGGSGTHRATDQATWGAYTNADDTDNPVLQLLWWMLGWEINGKLSVGCGIPYNRIDMPSFITAANICDENVTLAIGGTQKRYRASGTASDADERSDIINNLLISINGTLRDNGGKLTVTAMKNDLADYVLTLSENDMLGSFDWQQTRGLTENYNIVRGRYVDPSNNSLYQMVDYPEVSLASPDGIERVMSVDLPYIEDGRRAQRVAKQILQRNQYRGMFSTTFNAKALGCQVGDVVRVSLEALGFSNKLFRVVSQEIRFDGQVPMALIEENAAIYAWDTSDVAPITPTAPTIYDPLNNPIVLGIDVAGTTANYSAVVDDIGTKPENYATASDNMIVNGNFENGLTGWSVLSGSPVAYTESAGSVVGKGVYFPATATGDIRANNNTPFPINGATKIYMSGHTLASSLSGIYFRSGFTCYNSAGGVIGGVDGSITPATAGSYTPFLVILTPLTGTTHIVPYIYASGNPVIVYASNIRVSKTELAATVGAPSGTSIAGRLSDTVAETIKSDGVVNTNKVITDSITNNAVTVPASAYTTSLLAVPYATTGSTTIQTYTFTSTGGPILLTCTYTQFCSVSTGAAVLLYLYRDSTIIYGPVFVTAAGLGSQIAVSALDTPSAGTYTYTVQLQNKLNASNTCSVSYRVLTLMETKR
jgi:hypothetical protein